MINLKNSNTQTMVNLASSIITMAISMGISFFLSPYIVKTLGAEANGFTQLANNFIMYASLITVALNSMAGRFISISYHKNDLESANKYYSSVVIGNIIVILFLILPSIFSIYQLDKIINISDANIFDVKLLFFFVFINFFVSQISSMFGIATYVTNQLYITNIISIIRAFFNAVLLIFFFMCFNPKMYFVSLVGLILSLIMMIVTYEVKRRILLDVKFNQRNFQWNYIWKLISSGIWNTVNQCGNILMTGFDLLLANLLIDPIQMGILSVAKIVPTVIINLAATINTNFSPNLTIVYAQKGKYETLSLLRRSMSISSVLISIPIMVFCVYGIEFYKLWMPSLDAKSLTILSILTCMAFIPFAGPQVLYNVYTTTNRLALNSITVVIGGIVNFIIVFFLVKNTDLGIYAVAGVSAIISIIRNLLITVHYTAKILNLKWYTFYRDILVSLACCSLCLGISLIIKKLIIPSSWTTLIGSIGLAVFICLFGNIVLVLNKNEKKYLKDQVLRRKDG